MGRTGLLGDRYVLENFIGGGGMAEVYRARDQVLGRPVAVKILRDVAASPADRARFSDEARVLAGLNHPGLVTVLDAGTSADRPYLVMEFVDGPSLADCCRGAALEPARVAAIGAQLADALRYTHLAGVVHRDVKPGNVLLSPDDRVLLTDFGIAHLMARSADQTAAGRTMGTAAYLAPEQVRGENVTPATDVYSLGLVLLEALTGERVYRGAATEAALARLATAPAIPAGLPAPWHSLLRAMTALEPRRRPPTDGVAASLRELASAPVPGATVEPRVDSGHESAPRSPTPIGGENADAGLTRALQVPQESLLRHAGRRWRWIVGTACAGLVLILVSLWAAGGGEHSGSELPSNLPPGVELPLQELHDAVNG